MSDLSKNTDFEKEARQEEREKTLDQEQHKFGLMLKGKAHGLVIETNAAQGENPLNPNDPNSKKKKERDEAFYRKVLRDSMDYWRGQLNKIDAQLEAGKKLRDLYKKGKLDYDNPEHIALMNEYGITQEEIEAAGEGAFDDRDTELYEDRIEADNNYNLAAELEQKRAESPNDPKVSEEIDVYIDSFDEDESFYLGKVSAKDLNSNADHDTAFVPVEINFGSASKEIAPDDGIKFKSIKPEFNIAGSGDVAHTKEPAQPTTEPNQNITFSV